MTFENRLDAIGRFDIAGVTDRYRNLIRGVHNAGDTGDAERQVKWWEDAFGEERSRLANRIEETGARTNFPELLQPFGRAAQGLRPAFTRLSMVIATGSLDQFARWRFVARIYTARLTRLVNECLAIKEAAELRTACKGVLESVDPGAFRVLSANLNARRERMSAVRGGVAKERANASRSLDILRVIMDLEKGRRRKISHRDELLTRLRDHSSAGRSQVDVGPGHSIDRDIDELSRALQRLDSERAAAAARKHAKRVSAELRRAFGFPKAGGNSLLEDITSRLPEEPSV